MNINLEEVKLVIVGDAVINKKVVVNGETWNKGELLELLKIIDKSPKGYYVEVMNATLGGKTGVVDSDKLVIRHQGRYNLLEAQFLGDGTLLDASKLKILIPGREKVRWMVGDKLEIVRVGKMLGKKHFEVEVINLTQGSERALVSSKHIEIRNQRKFNALVLKHFQ